MLNVDTNTLESPFNDLNNLPSDVVSLRLFCGEHICIYVFFSPEPLNYQELFLPLFKKSDIKGLSVCMGVCVRGMSVDSSFKVFTFWQWWRC